MKSSFLRSVLRVASLLFFLLLAGCATLAPDGRVSPPRDGLDAFALEGRFSLRQDERSYSGRLSWRHTPAGDELLLSSPLGQGVAEIVVTPAAATLTTSDGKTYSAPDAPTLTQNVLGYRLPLDLLVDWVRGRNAAAEVVERDAQGRALRLRHEDWRIDYGYDSDDPQAPPGRLFAERAGAFELRLRIDEWISVSPKEPAP